MRNGRTETLILAGAALLLIGAGLIASPKTTVTIKPVHELAAEEAEMVYITESGQRYHADPACGGMKNALGVTVQEAIDAGYTPCAICANTDEDL